jgi:hypothetical protein
MVEGMADMMVGHLVVLTVELMVAYLAVLMVAYLVVQWALPEAARTVA